MTAASCKGNVFPVLNLGCVLPGTDTCGLTKHDLCFWQPLVMKLKLQHSELFHPGERCRKFDNTG